jgi:NAD(P)-dependent dehydrogenase (short-subunit alcohol dehydrogenase family)
VVEPDLGGKVAVITGAGRGLGKTLAQRYAAAGASVVLSGRSGTALEDVAEAIKRSGGKAACVVADVSRPADVQAMFDAAGAAFGRVSILVNNAGIAGPTAEIGDVGLDDWNDVLAVNLTGPFLCCRAAVPIMREAGGGKIVNIGSVSGKRPLAMRTPYTSSKMGLLGLTRTLAQEVGKYGINVNLISPWLVAGARLDLVIERVARTSGVQPAEVRAELVGLSPLGRGVSENDVANVALFLSSSAADNMTGQDINVSAGAVMY